MFAAACMLYLGCFVGACAKMGFGLVLLFSFSFFLLSLLLGKIEGG